MIRPNNEMRKLRFSQQFTRGSVSTIVLILTSPPIRIDCTAGYFGVKNAGRMDSWPLFDVKYSDEQTGMAPFPPANPAWRGNGKGKCTAGAESWR